MGIVKSDYYCNRCGISDVDDKFNCTACGDFMGDEE